jgi:hypothetical protein
MDLIASIRGGSFAEPHSHLTHHSKRFFSPFRRMAISSQNH